MTQTTRKAIFEQAARKLRQDFSELVTVPHMALKGGEAERLVRTFLSEHLPKRFGVSSGFILDRYDNVSKQTDVIIYDALNCPIYRASEDAGIFPNNNVAAVVEVKSRLDKRELISAFSNISAAKRLAKMQEPDTPLGWQTLGCLFAFESAITFETIALHLRELLKENGFGHHIDLILVLDQGVISLFTCPPNQPKWSPLFFEGLGGPDVEGWHIGLGMMNLGDESLDAFLRFILTKLSMFRGHVDHPGYNWNSSLPGGLVNISYLTTMCHEPDEGLKRVKVQAYFEEFMREMSQSAKPAAEEKK